MDTLDEEYQELALQAKDWIEAVTQKKFPEDVDFFESLSNGQMLCRLVPAFGCDRVTLSWGLCLTISRAVLGLGQAHEGALAWQHQENRQVGNAVCSPSTFTTRDGESLGICGALCL